MSDTIVVMNDRLGHFKDNPTARPLFNESNEQVGWLFSVKTNDDSQPSDIVISLLWSEYVSSPMCSHTIDNPQDLTRYQKLLHKPFIEGVEKEPFQNKYKRFYFYDKSSWHDRTAEDVLKLPNASYTGYGLVGFSYIDNEAEDLLTVNKESAQKIEIYLNDLEIINLVVQDLSPNEAFWKNKNDLWFNFTLNYNDYYSLLTYAEPLVSVYHQPLLAWHQPELSFSPYLGLFNWFYLD